MNRGERVIMARDGELMVATPLYKRTGQPLKAMKGYRISLENDEPTAWLFEYNDKFGVYPHCIYHDVVEDLGEL